MSNRLHIRGEYPPDRDQLHDRVRAEADGECIRCGRPDDLSSGHVLTVQALCQRCHLRVQGRVNPETTYFLEHSEWAKPYFAGFYAKKYECRNITREEATTRRTTGARKDRMTPTISFFVPGIPCPGGSKRAFVIKKGGVYTGRAIVVDDAGQRNKDWRQACVVVAQEHTPAELLRGPLRVDFAFVMPRLKSHFHSSKKQKGELRDDASKYHTIRPDVLKLVRSTEDALKGIIYADDAQTAQLTATKGYGDKPGCNITITPLVEAAQDDAELFAKGAA